jgi:hypothetical protein
MAQKKTENEATPASETSPPKAEDTNVDTAKVIEESSSFAKTAGPDDALDPLNRTREYPQPAGYDPHQAARVPDAKPGEPQVVLVPQR